VRPLLPLLLASSCVGELPPEGHVLLHVSTDAPLPAIFDRLRIDVIAAGAALPCAGCSREFDAAAPASVVIAGGAATEGLRVRVRYYRHGGTLAAEPRPASTLEQVIVLPAAAEEGATELSVRLFTDDVGRPVGTLEAPVAPEAGAPEPGFAGSWAGAAERPCEGAPGPGEVCVPGGAFWMGDPRLDLSAAGDLDGSLERLVVLAPFYLDAAEATVAAFRASGLAISLTPGVSDDPHEAGTGIPGCTYTTAPGANDAHPVNCLSWTRAAAYCGARGKALPSEAQLEFAAGGRRAERYPWGEDEPRCEDAVFERLGDCATLGEGPSVAGAGLRDRVAFGAAEIVDLAGNVSEWAADRWNREHEPCWGVGLFVDPLCDQSSAEGEGRTIRGGAFDSSAILLRAAIRSRVFNEVFGVAGKVGFRCARSAGPSYR
jgi:formylglycine-generating enzyme required for sulfatase activity